MILYDLAVSGYGLAIRAASLRNPKAAQWVSGRKRWREKLGQEVRQLGARDIIWVHCASYGEFEQGRPLIEGLRRKFPGFAIVLTFFSPSGFGAARNWQGADLVTYLPLDTPRNARDFIDLLRPRMAVFIKYEFWLNYLSELRARAIVTYLVSAVFKPHHPFFRWYGRVFRRSLRTFSHLFIQDEGSAKLLSAIGVSNHTVCGDTRFDRVMQIRQHFKPVSGIAEFSSGCRLIVAGSTWQRDNELVIGAFKNSGRKKLKLLIAPHEIDKKSIAALCAALRESDLSFSLYTKGADPDCSVLVLDTMGMLSRSYHYAEVAYIGGGFGAGLHNCLEAAVYGIPVTYSHGDHSRYNEVAELEGLGAAFPVKSAEDLMTTWMRLLDSDSEKAKISTSLESYFARNSNSADRVLAAMVI
jgi:3-deoxy-D-manno-octulosonic-acid transferase